MRVWPAFAAAVTLLFALFGAGRYFGAVLAAPIFGAILLALVALIAAGAGRAAMGALGAGALPEAEKTLLGAALGLGMMSLAFFGLCALRSFNSFSATAALGFFLILGAGELRRTAGAILQTSWRPEHPAAAGAIVLALGLVFCACWVPPHQYDALVYHLALPQAYVREGGFLTVKHLLFSHFPQNGELLFGLAVLWKCDILAHYFAWLATALCVGLVLSAPAEEAPAGTRFLAAFLLATHTAVMLLSSLAYVESLVMLWLTCALLCFLRFKSGGTRGMLVVSAVFLGLALGTKYYAGIAALVLGGDLLWRRQWRQFALYAGVTTAVFSPWLVKNSLMAGNPVFPFLYDYFPLTKTGWSASAARGYFQIMVEYGHAGTYLQDFLALPRLLLSNSLRYGGGMDVLGDLGWEFSFWCLPLGVWAAASSRLMRALLAFCAAYLALWFFTGVVLRFLTVIAPLLCLLAAGGLARLWTALTRAGRVALSGAAAILTIAHLFLFGFVHAVFGSEKILFGLESRQEFLSRRLDYYPCAVFARERLARNDRILIVGEQRGYYIEQDHMATTVHAPNRFISWANESSSAADLAGRIAREGFSHVLVVPAEARRLGPALGALSEEGLKHWQQLDAGHLETRFKGPACVVFGVKAAR